MTDNESPQHWLWAFLEKVFMRKWICFLFAMLLVISLSTAAFAVETVEQQIRELPTVEEFKAMDQEAQVDAYNRTQYAYDAYMALSGEEKEAIEGAEEIFESLFAHFNTLVAPAGEMEESGKIGSNVPVWIVIAALIATLITLAAKKHRK